MDEQPPLAPEGAILHNPPPPINVLLDELGDQLRTAQAEIGQIRLERQEEKTPLWRQPAIVISIAGLLLSAGFSGYTARDQANQRKLEDKKQKTATLDSGLAEIVALRMEDTRQASALASTNPTAYRAWSENAAAKRAMLIDAAVAAVRDLNYDISATAALVLGTELVQDSRLPDAEKVLIAGVKAAAVEGSATGTVQSALAQVYMLPGTKQYDPAKGRSIYNEAIDSFSSLSDFSALNRKLGVIQWWASAEANLGHPDVSSKLIQKARSTLAGSPLSPTLKAPLATLTENVANQIRLTTSGNNFDASRILGSWRVADFDRKAGSLIISLAPGSAVPLFAKDKIESGILVGRITGTVYYADLNHLRLDWNLALAMNPGTSPQMAGYSEIRLRPDGTMEGIDYAFNLPARTWVAKKAMTAQ